MSYITQQDYSAICSVHELDVFQQSDPSIRGRAERAAMEEAAGYLRSRYDIEKIYSQEGDARNAQLVQVIASLSLYQMAFQLPGKTAFSQRQIQYENAISWLKGVQKGSISPNLPLIGSGSSAVGGGAYPIQFGGMDKNTYDY